MKIVPEALAPRRSSAALTGSGCGFQKGESPSLVLTVDHSGPPQILSANRNLSLPRRGHSFGPPSGTSIYSDVLSPGM